MRLLGTGKTLTDDIINFVNPRRPVPTHIMDVISRMEGGRSAEQFVITRQLDKWSKRMDKMSKAQLIDFVDQIKAGTRPLDAELTQIADFIRKADDNLHRAMAKYKPSLPYLKNHFRVLWKVIPGTKGVKGSGVGRRPLQGSKGMLKQHTLDSMSEGIAMGGEPYSYNPLVMFAQGYADAMKFITAQRLWEEFGKMGARKFVKTNSDRPEWFKQLDDRLAKVYFPVPQGMVDAGDWYVQEGAAEVLNNLLGHDYLRDIREGADRGQLALAYTGRALLFIKNNTTAIELSISPYHAVFETIEAMGSMMGIGLRQMVNLGFGPLIGPLLGLKVGAYSPNPVQMIGQGLKTMAMSPAAFVGMAKQGGTARKMYANYDEMKNTVQGRKWLRDNPGAIDNIPYYFTGGGNADMPEDFQIHAQEGFKRYLADAMDKQIPGHSRTASGIKALASALPAINQAIMHPLFGVYIPNLKMAFFLKEFALAKAEYAGRLASGEMTLEQLARRVVGSVENRFGEVNFDRLFWNRTMKTALQIIFRSVTWKLGNLGEGWNAFSKQAQEIVRGGRGRDVTTTIQGASGQTTITQRTREVPQLDMSMGWLIGVGLMTAIVGTIMTVIGSTGKDKDGKFRLGHGPKTFKDVMFPIIDDQADLRVSTATYARDYYHLQHDPMGYVKSSASGWIGKFWEAAENKDWQRNPVYNEDDPMYKKMWDIVNHQVPAPFGVSGAYKALKQGHVKEAVANALAFTKAPAYIDKSEAELMAQEFAGRHREEGTRTTFEANKAKAAAEIRNAFRKGLDPQPAIQSAKQSGFISDADVAAYKTQASRAPLLGSIERLTMPEMLRVYDKGTEEERRQIYNQVRAKVFREKALHPAMFDDETRRLSLKYFNTEPYRAPKPPSIFGRLRPVA